MVRKSRMTRPNGPMRVSTTQPSGKRKKKKVAHATAQSTPIHKKKGYVPGLLGALGGAAGSFFGGGPGGILGKKAGDWLGSITGMGDYTVNSNSLMTNSNGPPLFRASENGHILVRHREFVTNITGSTAFTNAGYDINPGLRSLFAWLSGMANLYEQWIPRGIVVEFKSTSATALNSTNTALGKVIMTTNYDVTDPDFGSQLAMNNYEFTTTCKPSESMLHPIECNPNRIAQAMLYTRSNSIPESNDQRLYDLGRFQIATVGMQAAATIGELWISYDVEFLRPKLPNPLGETILSCHLQGDLVPTASYPTGINALSGSNLPATVSTNGIIFPYPGRYRIEVIVSAGKDATTFSGDYLGTASTDDFKRVDIWINNTTEPITHDATRSVFLAGTTVKNFDYVYDVFTPNTEVTFANTLNSLNAVRGDQIIDYDIYIDTIPSNLGVPSNRPLSALEKKVDLMERTFRHALRIRDPNPPSIYPPFDEARLLHQKTVVADDVRNVNKVPPYSSVSPSTLSNNTNPNPPDSGWTAVSKQ